MRNAIFLITIGIIYIIIINRLEDHNNHYKEKIGTEYILEKDTLTVVDYSFISETFTLSDGRKVNAALIFYQENK